MGHAAPNTSSLPKPSAMLCGSGARRGARGSGAWRGACGSGAWRGSAGLIAADAHVGSEAALSESVDLGVNLAVGCKLQIAPAGGLRI